VRAKTAFDVACVDTRQVNGRKNVGLVIDLKNPVADVADAQDVFIAAAKDRNIILTRGQVVFYTPDSAPRMSRIVQSTPKRPML